MYRRFQVLVACWFVVQIILPFTAPLQTCDLADLLGTAHHHGSTTSPEASATPTDAGASNPPAATLKISEFSTTVVDLIVFQTSTIIFVDLPSPQVHQTILRL